MPIVLNTLIRIIQKLFMKNIAFMVPNLNIKKKIKIKTISQTKNRVERG